MFHDGNSAVNAKWLGPSKRRMQLDDDVEMRGGVLPHRRRALFGAGDIGISDSHREDRGRTSSGVQIDDRRCLSASRGGATVKAVVVRPLDKSYLERFRKASEEDMIVISKPGPDPVLGSFMFEVLGYFVH
jgi:hypothetical protein